MSELDIEQLDKDQENIMSEIEENNNTFSVIGERLCMTQDLKNVMRNYTYKEYALGCYENRYALLYVPSFIEYMYEISKRFKIRNDDISSLMSKMTIH